MTINGRLQRIDKTLPPTIDDLWRVLLQVAKTSQRETNALRAIGAGDASAHNIAIVQAWLTKNEARGLAAWNRAFPGGWNFADIWAESREQ